MSYRLVTDDTESNLLLVQMVCPSTVFKSRLEFGYKCKSKLMLLAVRPWATFLQATSLNIPTCKIGIIVIQPEKVVMKIK